MKPKLTSRGGRIAIAVLVVAITVFVFRSEVLALLVEPIGWLLWAGWRLVASVDQGVCWAMVILISAVLAIRLLPARLGAPEESAPAHESQWGRAGRLDYWEQLASLAAESPEGRTAFKASLAALADAVAESTKQTPRKPSLATGTARLWTHLSQLLAGGRRRADLRLIEEELSWMESALEIKHEHSVD